MKMKPLHCVETLGTKWSVMQHDIPEERIPHDDMYFHSPQCRHNTADQKTVVEYQEQGKSRK